MSKAASDTDTDAFDEVPPSDPAQKDRVWWGRFLTRRAQFVLDLGVLTAAFFFAYLLRFEFRIPPAYAERALVQAPLVVLLQFAALFWAGVYGFLWKYVEVRPWI